VGTPFAPKILRVVNSKKGYDQMHRLLLVLLLGALLLAGCTPTEPVVIEPPPEPDPEREPEPELPGVLLAMIDNHPNANPQSGLLDADIVYEMMAEGGITRYLAVFYSKKPELIGPIRSARYYFVQTAKAYNAPYAHVGGHDTAFRMIDELKVPDVCSVRNSGSSFWRDRSRKMPHNTYTSADELLQVADRRKLPLTPLTPFPSGEAPDGGEAAERLELTYSESKSFTYKVVYEFVAGEYRRYINGKEHCDKATGQQLAAGCVVVLEVPQRSVVDSKGVLISEVELIGQGNALFCRDGQVFRGTWRKGKPQEHFSFTYQGETMPLSEEGPIWIQVVASLKNVSYMAGEK
jgi:hypothetical protein